MTNHRVQRLAGELQKEIAAILDREIKDPRLAMVSVVSVQIAPDGCSAHIHVSSMRPEGAAQGDIQAALESAKGYIRRELGKRLKTRIIPELFFNVDESISNGVRMMKVIQEQIAADEAAAAGRPPEDPDKYVKE